MDEDVIALVSALAASQHGVIGLDQFRFLGGTRHQLRQAVKAGWLVMVAPRVYAVAGAPPTVDRLTMTGLLALGPDAVVSHEAAARLLGFDRSASDAVEFTVPRSRRGVRLPFTVHTSVALPRIDCVTFAGFRCTSATRTILDLAHARVPTVRLEAAIDSAVRSGASSPVVIERRLAELRGRGRFGTPRIDALLPDSGGHTVLERRFLELVRRAGLPRPATQVVHRRGARTFARVDFLFADSGAVVEVSGRLGHASDAERARDAQRRNELQAIGRRVFEFTARQVLNHPGEVGDFLVRELLGPASVSAPG